MLLNNEDDNDDDDDEDNVCLSSLTASYVSHREQSDSARYLSIYAFSDVFHYRLLQDIEYSFLCCIVCVCVCVCGQSLESCLTLRNPMTVAHQNPPFMQFSRQEY